MSKISIQFPLFSATSRTALERCVSSYQQPGCRTPHVEIKKPAFEVILDVFTHTGDISERYPYESVCAPPPSDRGIIHDH